MNFNKIILIFFATCFLSCRHGGHAITGSATCTLFASGMTAGGTALLSKESEDSKSLGVSMMMLSGVFWLTSLGLLAYSGVQLADEEEKTQKKLERKDIEMETLRRRIKKLEEKR